MWFSRVSSIVAGSIDLETKTLVDSRLLLRGPCARDAPKDCVHDPVSQILCLIGWDAVKDVAIVEGRFARRIEAQMHHADQRKEAEERECLEKKLGDSIAAITGIHVLKARACPKVAGDFTHAFAKLRRRGDANEPSSVATDGSESDMEKCPAVRERLTLAAQKAALLQGGRREE